MYNFRRAYIAAILATVGFLFHYVPMLILGLQGMPRRYYDYLPQYAQGNALAAVGGVLLFVGVVLMLVNLLLSFRTKVAAPANPWGGCTLEWAVPSPPPLHNFEGEPRVLDYPYDFSEVLRNKC
jgi:cytochrome c oxidase subunit 1